MQIFKRQIARLALLVAATVLVPVQLGLAAELQGLNIPHPGPTNDAPYAPQPIV